MPSYFPDEDTAYHSDMWDALVYAMTPFVMPRTRRSGRHFAGTFSRRRRFGKPMFTIKDDDSQITWNAEAMAQRAFREVAK